MTKRPYKIIKEIRITKVPIVRSRKVSLSGKSKLLKVFVFLLTLIGAIASFLELYDKVPMIWLPPKQLPQINSVQEISPIAKKKIPEKEKVPEKKAPQIEESFKTKLKLNQPRGPSYWKKKRPRYRYHRTYDSRRLYERWYDY